MPNEPGCARRARVWRYSARTSGDIASSVRCSSGGRFGTESSYTASVEVIATFFDVMSRMVARTGSLERSSVASFAMLPVAHWSGFLSGS
jgi:hypothetical protein